MLQKLIPWTVLITVCISSGVYFWELKKEAATRKQELSTALLKITEVDKSLAVAKAKLVEKDKEIQDLKLLQSPPALSGLALHVIGVYQGKEMPNIDNSPWWAKCNGPEFSQLSKAEANSACHTKYAGQTSEKIVNVHVSDTTRPIVLALSSYDKTHWKVNIKPGVDIKKVILGGYHSQRVSGLPDTVIETYTYESSPCPKCVQMSSHFYSYESPDPKIKAITGLDITSFQGKYSGESFSVFAGMPPFGR